MPAFWAPHVTVAALIEENGRFLMVEEYSPAGGTVWNQPAGHLEADESLIQAVIRETMEESAWRFEPQALLGVYQLANPHTNATYLRFCFTGRHYGHDPQRPLDQDIRRTLWATREELAANGGKLRSPMVLKCVDDYLQGVRYPLDLYQTL